MRALLQRLASTRLTLVGMALLSIGAGLSYDNPEHISVWALNGPLLLLSLNLFAAILVLPAINRRPGLLMFHLGLLSICLLAGIGRLTYFDARIEIDENSAFTLDAMRDVKQGPWHMGDLSQVKFIQQGFSVEYGAGLIRGRTRSHVLLSDGFGGWKPQVVGDDRPLIIDGFRFYTTFNKGFSALLTWVPDQGESITGSIHMPSYPLFEYRQDNSWTPPGAEQEIKFWLRLNTGYTLEEEWLLDGYNASAILVVNDGDQRVELAPGSGIQLPDGYLRYEGLSTWMGYKIFYDPTLMWLFFAAMMTVLGLCIHYWQKFSDQPMREADRKKELGNL